MMFDNLGAYREARVSGKLSPRGVQREARRVASHVPALAEILLIEVVAWFASSRRRRRR
jgi:hypothetical protein